MQNALAHARRLLEALKTLWQSTLTNPVVKGLGGGPNLQDVTEALAAFREQYATARPVIKAFLPVRSLSQKTPAIRPPTLGPICGLQTAFETLMEFAERVDFYHSVAEGTARDLGDDPLLVAGAFVAGAAGERWPHPDEWMTVKSLLTQEALAMEAVPPNDARTDLGTIGDGGALQSDANGGASADDDSDIRRRTVALYTGGLSEERFGQIAAIVGNSDLSVAEKLEKIDAIMPIPAKASARGLGTWLKVSHTAIRLTPWWDKNRAGQGEAVIEGRHKRLKAAGEVFESPIEDD